MFALEIYDAQFPLKTLRCMSIKINVNTRFEYIYYCKIRWNFQYHSTSLMCTDKISLNHVYLLIKKDYSRQSLLHIIHSSGSKLSNMLI